MSQPAHAQASRKDAWVGIVTALPAEARCLGQRVRAGARAELTPAVYLTVAGIGETRAMQAADALARDGASGLMSFGVAGALDPSLRPGDLLLPDCVIGPRRRHAADLRWRDRVLRELGAETRIVTAPMLHSDVPLHGVAQKREAWETTRACAVDMESAGIAHIAQLHGLSFMILRAVADPSWRALPAAALAAVDPDGGLRPFSLLRALFAKPADFGALRDLSADFRAARRSLHAAWKKTACLYQP